ncbi:unnamed protein product [Somion occarium]|uniref:Uncharacterized protein n=1 Tax=Somion occarium TaxID=3059160 RepID=A0ABP1E1J3_9APHY
MPFKITKLSIGTISSRHPHGILPHADHIRGLEQWRNNRKLEPAREFRKHGEITLIRNHLRRMFPGFYASVNTIKHALANHDSPGWTEFREEVEKDRWDKLIALRQKRGKVSGKNRLQEVKTSIGGQAPHVAVANLRSSASVPGQTADVEQVSQEETSIPKEASHPETTGDESDFSHSPDHLRELLSKMKVSNGFDDIITELPQARSFQTPDISH